MEKGLHYSSFVALQTGKLLVRSVNWFQKGNNLFTVPGVMENGLQYSFHFLVARVG